MTNLDRVAGSNGMVIVDDTTTYTKVVNYFIPREDTVLDTCTGVDNNGNAVDFKTTQNWDGTLKESDYCMIPAGYKITNLTLTSGSVQCF